MTVGITGLILGLLLLLALGMLAVLGSGILVSGLLLLVMLVLHGAHLAFTVPSLPRCFLIYTKTFSFKGYQLRTKYGIIIRQKLLYFAWAWPGALFQRRAAAVRCPFCSHPESKVVDSRPSDEGSSIRRRRECLACHKRFTTYETMESLPLMVIKKDGSRQTFDKTKLLNGMIRAC